MLEGVYDFHVHSAPDVVKRKLTDIELAQEARKRGMKGLVIKNHLFETAARATTASQVVRGIKVFGGIVLNESVGGLNPRAVEACLQLGGKVIWMPTMDARNHREKVGQTGGITILDLQGHLLEPVAQIMEVVRAWDAILATGHLSLEETFVLVKEARAMGLKKLVLTHPEFWITRTPLEAQKELARKGVLMERCYYSCTLKDRHRVSPQEIAHHIQEVGASSTILASDLGQEENPLPPLGLELFLKGLLEAGLKEEDVEVMVKENPERLLFSPF